MPIFAWTTQNQLHAVEQPAGDIITYTWAPVTRAAEERQVLRDDGTDETRFVWDNQNIAREVLNSSLEAEFTYQPQRYGHLVSQRRDATTSIYHFDALGSTIALTEPAVGGTTDDYRFQAFGKTIYSTGSTTNPYGWVGQLGYRTDEETGLFNLRNRDYTAGQGRFLSEDPIGLAGGDSNFYRYVGNDAVNRVDPDGLAPPRLWFFLPPENRDDVFPRPVPETSNSDRLLKDWELIDSPYGFPGGNDHRVEYPDYWTFRNRLTGEIVIADRSGKIIKRKSGKPYDGLTIGPIPDPGCGTDLNPRRAPDFRGEGRVVDNKKFCDALVQKMNIAERIMEAMKIAYEKNYVTGEIRDLLEAIVTPPGMYLTLGFLTVAVAAQVTPAGWVADLALILAAAGIGIATAEALAALKEFATIVSSATTCDDIDRAAKKLAEALVLGIGATAGAKGFKGRTPKGGKGTPRGKAPQGSSGRFARMNPNDIRFSQNSAGGRGRAAQLRESMRNGWNGPAVDAVETADGIVTIDNTRIAIARELGITEVPVKIHLPSDPLPESMLGRFGDARTWGEALQFRTGNQRPPLPPTGTPNLPRLPQ